MSRVGVVRLVGSALVTGALLAALACGGIVDRSPGLGDGDGDGDGGGNGGGSLVDAGLDAGFGDASGDADTETPLTPGTACPHWAPWSTTCRTDVPYTFIVSGERYALPCPESELPGSKVGIAAAYLECRGRHSLRLGACNQDGCVSILIRWGSESLSVAYYPPDGDAVELENVVVEPASVLNDPLLVPEAGVLELVIRGDHADAGGGMRAVEIIVTACVGRYDSCLG